MVSGFPDAYHGLYFSLALELSKILHGILIFTGEVEDEAQKKFGYPAGADYHGSFRL
jgi:hypothetical protein